MSSKKLYYTVFVFLFVAFGLITNAPVNAQEDERTLTLKAPDKKGGMPLMQALAQRKSSRNFSDTPLSDQELSNLIWAAYGINRDDGKRTIPTARNQQKMNLYVGFKDHVWIYDPQNHALQKMGPADLKGIMKGSVLLIMAEEGGDEKSNHYGNLHAGSIYQNVGLYCASAGLGNLVHINGADKVQEIIAPFLPSKYTVRILQSVGKIK